MQRSVFLQTVRALACAACLPLAAAPALAQAPDKPLGSAPFTIVAPFVAGGPVDILARVLATGLTERYKQPAIVDNRPGAGGQIGIDLVKRAKPDGHTLLVVPQGNLTITPTLQPQFAGRMLQDFVPVASLGRSANVIAVNPAVPVKDIQDLVALSKAQRDSISYASPGVGSSLHLAGELFKEQTGADMMHVAYKGSAPGLTDVLGGAVPVIIGNMPTVLPHVQSGKLRALAVTDAARTPFLPEVPTLAEAGIAGVAVSSWYGVLAPKGLAPAAARQLADDVERILQTPAAQQQLKLQGLSPWVVKNAAFAELIQKETALWKPIIQGHQIQAQ